MGCSASKSPAPSAGGVTAALGSRAPRETLDGAHCGARASLEISADDRRAGPPARRPTHRRASRDASRSTARESPVAETRGDVHVGDGDDSTVVWRCPAPSDVPAGARACSPWFTRARDASRAESGPDVEWRLFWDLAGDGAPESCALYLECRRRERRGFSRDAAAPASRFPGAGTKRAAMRRETKIEEVHACFSFALLPGPDAKKPRAAKTGEHREARRDDEAFLDEKNEISVADDAAPREVSRLNLAGPVVEMVASIRETLGWPSKGKVGAESDASADDDDAQKNVFFCACGTRRCAFLALPRSDGDALRMDRLMAHRFVLPPTAASFSTTTDASPPKNTPKPSSAHAGVHARRKSLNSEESSDVRFDEDESKERLSFAWGCPGLASRGALASGDALVCLSFHDEVVGFAEAADGGLTLRAREGGDDSGYDDSGDDETEEEEVEGGVGGDKSAFEATEKCASSEKKKNVAVPPRRLPPAAHRASRRRGSHRSGPPAESPLGAPRASAQLLSESPLMFVLDDFLSERECEDLMSLARPDLRRSRVTDGKLSEGRTSSSTFLTGSRQDNPVVKAVERRILRAATSVGRIVAARAAHRTTDRFDDLFTARPAARRSDTANEREAARGGSGGGFCLPGRPAAALVGAEPMQIVRYESGEMYTAHYDNKQGCVRRAATFMMYLRDVEAGGATHFPKAKAFGKGADADGVRVWPKRGRALVFWSVRGGVEDVRSLHEAEPVAAGEKWIATKGMQVAEESPTSG